MTGKPVRRFIGLYTVAFSLMPSRSGTLMPKASSTSFSASEGSASALDEASSTRHRIPGTHRANILIIASSSGWKRDRPQPSSEGGPWKGSNRRGSHRDFWTGLTHTHGPGGSVMIIPRDPISRGLTLEMVIEELLGAALEDEPLGIAGLRKPVDDPRPEGDDVLRPVRRDADVARVFTPRLHHVEEVGTARRRAIPAPREGEPGFSAVLATSSQPPWYRSLRTQKSGVVLVVCDQSVVVLQPVDPRDRLAGAPAHCEIGFERRAAARHRDRGEIRSSSRRPTNARDRNRPRTGLSAMGRLPQPVSAPESYGFRSSGQ